MKKNHLVFMAILVGINAMISCTPKYTASFGPSQRFYESDSKSDNDIPGVAGDLAEKVTMKEDKVIQKNEKVIEDKNGEGSLTASTSVSKLAMDAPVKHVDEIIKKYESKKALLDKTAVKDLSSKEKKVLIKEVRKDIKELKKAQKKSSIENRKIYAGIIIALAGIVVAILVSGTIGGLGILVGVVLIAWGLIEEGEL